MYSYDNLFRQENNQPAPHSEERQEPEQSLEVLQ